MHRRTWPQLPAPSPVQRTRPARFVCLLVNRTQHTPQNFGPILGHGIFTSDGAEWYWQRKLATNIFSVKRCVTWLCADLEVGQKLA